MDDAPKSEELAAVRRAVCAVLLDANTSLLFGAPVDTSLLPDYTDVISSPRDLGTILQNIDASLQQGSDGPYKTASHVLKDVNLVWANCIRYNNRSEDAAVREIAGKSAHLFEQEIRKVGLEGLEELSNSTAYFDADPSSSMAFNDADFESLPLRLLTNFEVVSAADPTVLCRLDSLLDVRAGNGALLISGDLIPPEGAPPDIGGQPLDPEKLIDWVVEYSGAVITVWVVSSSAWYKLMQPSPRYSTLYTTSVQGVALTREALEELAAGEDSFDVPDLIDRIAENLSSPDISTEPTAEFSAAAKALAVAHVETKLGKRKFRSRAGRKRRGGGSGGFYFGTGKRGRGMGGRVGSRSRLGDRMYDGDDSGEGYIGDEVDAMSDDDMPDDFLLSASDDDDDDDGDGSEGNDGGGGGIAPISRSRAWKRMKYWKRRSETEDRQRRCEEAALHRERMADEARGEPPVMQCSSRLPVECLPDLLMVWEFAQSFRDALQLPPFTLSALEAALDPGPRMRCLKGAAEQHEEEEAPEEKEEKAVVDGDEIVGAGEKSDLQIVRDAAVAVVEEEQQGGVLKLETDEQQQQQPEKDEHKVQQEEELVAVLLPSAMEGVIEAAPEAEDTDKLESEKMGAVDDSINAHAQNEQNGFDPVVASPLLSPLPPAGTTGAEVPLPTVVEATPVVRKRGRPRKIPATATPPALSPDGKQLSWQHKAAPQNFIYDPTVKTRRQKGVEPSLSEKAIALAADNDGNVFSESKPFSKFKLKLTPSSSSGLPLLHQGYDNSTNNNNNTNHVAAALSSAQAAHDAHTAMLKSKYNLTPEFLSTMSPLDRDSAASGLLLRDLVCSLASTAAGLLPGAVVGGFPAPETAQIDNPDAEHPTWPERLANTVWGTPGSSPEARQAALKLAYGDFLDLSAVERLSLLAALTHAALSSEEMMNEVTMRVDQFGAMTNRRDGGPGDEFDDEGNRLAVAAAAAAVVVEEEVRVPPQRSSRPPPPPPVEEDDDDEEDEDEEEEDEDGEDDNDGDGKKKTARKVATAAAAEEAGPLSPNFLELWHWWYSAQNLGARRPVGVDFRGRRYWALGRQSGAFRIYCEDPGDNSWGWYEGEDVAKLVTWLRGALIRCESPLIIALKAAPLPLSAPTTTPTATPSDTGVDAAAGGGGGDVAPVPNAPHYLVGEELAPLLADGYRGFSLPLLRGEWNSRKEGSGAQPPAMEQRIPLAVDVMLGSIPYWFKGGVVQRHVMAISDVLAAAHSGRDAARALLETERLLSAEGRVSTEWTDLWQMNWRLTVASVTDIKEIPLCTAALQSHVKTAPDILPRPAFMKIATETSFVLTIPSLGDTVLVLRAGLLQHIDRYMQIVGATTWQEAAPLVNYNNTMNMNNTATATTSSQDGGEKNGAMVTEAAGASISTLPLRTEDEEDYDQEEAPAEKEKSGGKGSSHSAAHAPAAPASVRRIAAHAIPLLAAPRLQHSSVERIKREWEVLRSRAAAMRPAERYIVRSIVYRRHLADYADLQRDEDSEAAPRAPVAWVFLRPVKNGPRHQLPTEDLVVPVAIVPGLPDYLLKVDAYVKGTRVSWQAGDRFRMFFGGKISEKTQKKVKAGGAWHRGEVVSVDPPAPSRGATLAVKEAYDPWESVAVRWDHLAQDYLDIVNPWELEVDPEEENRRGDEARRQMQAAARAQRARTSARRAFGHPDAAAQAALWAEEDAKVAMWAAQAERAELLLDIHKAKPEPEETVFNEGAYGSGAVQQSHHGVFTTLGGGGQQPHATTTPGAGTSSIQLPIPMLFGDASGNGGASGSGYHAALAASAAAAGTRSSGVPLLSPFLPSSAPPGPFKPGQEVSMEVLEALRLLTAPQFTTLFTNFYRGLRGKDFKIPRFAHQELNLHAVWWAVMEYGGYESVTANKQWKDICKAMPSLDLSGQTSASYNMRSNYERCLLDFENYLASGQYEEDVKGGRAPVHTVLTDPLMMKFAVPGTYPSPPLPLPTAAAALPNASDGLAFFGSSSSSPKKHVIKLVMPSAARLKTETTTGAEQPQQPPPPPLPVEPTTGATEGEEKVAAAAPVISTGDDAMDVDAPSSL